MTKCSLLFAASASVLSVCAMTAVPAYASSPDIDVDIETEAEAETGGTAANEGSIAISDESSDSSTDNSVENEAEKGGNAANGGSTVTNDESDNSVEYDAEKGGKNIVASNVASKGGVNGNSDESDNSEYAVAKYGSNAANNGGTATYSYANVVSSSYLKGYVTGNHVVYIVPANGGDGSDSDAAFGASASAGTGGPGGKPLIDNSISMDRGAMSDFAGLNAQNLNTGVGASQNASINVSASLGALNLGGQ